MVIRPASAADLPAVLPVFEAAKAIMRASGNLDQWSAPGFPGPDLLQRDLDRAGGFVIETGWPVAAGHDEATAAGHDEVTAAGHDEATVGHDKTEGVSVMPGAYSSVMPGLTGHLPQIVAYFALLPSPEPTYDRIDGAWLTDGPYGVIHRIASYPGVHGIFSAVIDYAAQRYAHLRIDTHRDNRIMQHLIEKHGFTYCGIIWLPDGSERLAYER